jgi:hypothetical protein
MKRKMKRYAIKRIIYSKLSDIELMKPRRVVDLGFVPMTKGEAEIVKSKLIEIWREGFYCVNVIVEIK